MPVYLTYFVHGTTTDNENGLASGWLPGSLSGKGKLEAKYLGDMVADKHFDIVFCSDLKRAIDSASLSFGNKYEIVQDQRLRECNYGDLNGKPASRFKDHLEQYITASFPGGESYKEVQGRLEEFINYLRSNYAGLQIAIVAHQAPQLALDVILSGKTWQQAMDEDWRKTSSWRPGWKYIISD